MTTPQPKKGKKEVAEIAPSSDIVPDTMPKAMTFAEVMAWNRANADKLPPAVEKSYGKPKKMNAM